MIELIFRLLIAHALCDFSLQSGWMIDAKYRIDISSRNIENISHWSIAMTAHAIICGAGVWWATGVVWLGLIEVVAHWLIDLAKCENWTNPNDDQAAHILCRVFYVILMVIL